MDGVILGASLQCAGVDADESKIAAHHLLPKVLKSIPICIQRQKLHGYPPSCQPNFTEKLDAAESVRLRRAAGRVVALEISPLSLFVCALNVMLKNKVDQRSSGADWSPIQRVYFSVWNRNLTDGYFTHRTVSSNLQDCEGCYFHKKTASDSATSWAQVFAGSGDLL